MPKQITVLSKSRLLALRQCPRRLWLELHQPDLREDTRSTQASFQVGHEIGAIARVLYDTRGDGTELSPKEGGIARMLVRTTELLAAGKPIFEAAFSSGEAEAGALAIADVLLPERGSRGTRRWRMIEVKSTGSVKDYQRDDAAIQWHVANEAGLRLSSISVAHIDTKWRYPGGDDFQGLLREIDLTEEAESRRDEVRDWIVEGHRIARARKAPHASPGRHCNEPFACGFSAYCQAEDDTLNGRAERPVSWLPRIQAKALLAYIEGEGVRAMDDVPDHLLNPQQLRVKQHTLTGTTFFDAAGAAKALHGHRLPALFLDFETIASAVPLWAGTRPYQAVPFQFSLHRLGKRGALEHSGFLDLSGQDPRAGFARTLVEACTGNEPIFVYNRGFEGARIRELAADFPAHASALTAISDRLIDLEPVARAHYYAPSQQGSWSIKVVLPAMAPELRYDALDGVQDGGGAQTAYLEALHSQTSPARKAELRAQLWAYCRLDTFAMVRVWAHLAGRTALSRDDLAPSRDLTI